MSGVTVGHEIESEAVVCKNGDSVYRVRRLRRSLHIEDSLSISVSLVTSLTSIPCKQSIGRGERRREPRETRLVTFDAVVSRPSRSTSVQTPPRDPMTAAVATRTAALFALLPVQSLSTVCTHSKHRHRQLGHRPHRHHRHCRHYRSTVSVSLLLIIIMTTIFVIIIAVIITVSLVIIIILIASVTLVMIIILTASVTLVMRLSSPPLSPSSS